MVSRPQPWAGSLRAVPRGRRTDDGTNDVSTWLVLLILAVIAAIIGFATAAKWLFIIAVVLLLVGLVTSLAGRRGTRV